MRNKISVLLILVILIFLVTSCSSEPKREPDIIGIIYSMDKQAILVVEGVELDTSYDEWFEDGKWAINFQVNDKTVIKQGKEKISFGDLEKGQMVKVWSTGPLGESYPLHGFAQEIILLEE